MVGVIIALAITLAVGYMIVKKYKPQPVLIIGSFILIMCSLALGATEVVPTKSSTGFWGFDLYALIRLTLSSRIAALGITIMTVGGFVKYMNHIGASRALVHVAVNPLKRLKAPYVVLTCSYLIGQFLGLFINSASGLGMLLMVTMFPILIQLGISRLSAAAIIGTTLCIDWSPGNVGPTLAAGLSNLDLMTYWYTYQLPVCLIDICAVALLHFFVQQWFDRRQPQEQATDEEFVVLNDGQEDSTPKFYWILPMLPLTLLLLFSSIGFKTIKLGIIEAMLISLTVAMICELFRNRNLQECFKDVQVFFDGMGMQFAGVVTLVVSGEMFAKGLQSIGAIKTIITAADSAGFTGTMMMVVMVVIIGASTVVMGSGNASFLTFANLVPDISAKLAIYPPLLLVPMELTSSIARSVSPITAVIVVVSGIAKVSPVDLVKRTAIPMAGAFVVNILAMMLLFYH